MDYQVEITRRIDRTAKQWLLSLFHLEWPPTDLPKIATFVSEIVASRGDKQISIALTPRQGIEEQSSVSQDIDGCLSTRYMVRHLNQWLGVIKPPRWGKGWAKPVVTWTTIEMSTSLKDGVLSINYRGLAEPTSDLAIPKNAWGERIEIAVSELRTLLDQAAREFIDREPVILFPVSRTTETYTKESEDRLFVRLLTELEEILDIPIHVNPVWGITPERMQTRTMPRESRLSNEGSVVNIARSERQDARESRDVRMTSQLFSQEECTTAVQRARTVISSDAALREINRRLGLHTTEIPAVICQSAGLDRSPVDGSPGMPVIHVDSSVVNYLGLDPDDFDGVQFAWTLGVYADPIIGTVPVFFLGVRYQMTDRLVAAVWSLTKCTGNDWDQQRASFDALASAQLPDAAFPGAEGGLTQISPIGIIVERLTGGLDVMTTPHLIPAKLWKQLNMGIHHNAVTSAFLDTAEQWPYPTDLGGDSFFGSPATAGFSRWY
jgi:hypothetical protein